MRLSVTLELLEAIVTEHERTVTGFSVLHCVHESLVSPGDNQIIDAIVQRARGTYVDCDPASPWPPPARGVNMALARQLEALAKARGILVTIGEVDGKASITVNESEELTGGDAILGRVFATLCARDVGNLLVYTYSLAELDEARAAVIWQAASALDDGAFTPQGLKTLVPIALGAIDVERHCNVSSQAVRFVAREREFIRRPPGSQSMLAQILRSRDERIVLFLGAGASASARIPQGDKLRDHSIGEVLGKRNVENPAAAFLEYLKWKRERWLAHEQNLTPEQFEASLTLERTLREEFHNLGHRPRSESGTIKELSKVCLEALDRNPRGRKAIHELPGLLPKLVIATVNFDQLIEEGMPTESLVAASVAQLEAAGATVHERVRGATEIVPILKLHGSISDPGTIVADIDQTEKGLPASVSALLDLLVAPIADASDTDSARDKCVQCGSTCDHGGPRAHVSQPVTWVWIGCSMRDRDLRHWLLNQDGTRIHEYWVDPLPPQSVAEYAREARRKQWGQLGVTLADRLITESSDLFLEALVSHARALPAL